jgi:ubiquinone/menaquinone biosynthesis C-methylase UbiE
MVLGLLPDQQMAVREMVRVLGEGGVLALSTHGPDHCQLASKIDPPLAANIDPPVPVTLP